MQSILIKYPYHVKEKVVIKGEWDNWKDPLDLIWNGSIWEIEMSLPIGQYSYKYIVDGVWTYDSKIPTIKDNSNNINNYFQVVDPDLPQMIVVLGERLSDDGQPSDILKDRVATAVKYFSEHSGNIIACIMTGGPASNQNHLPEALCMEKIAIESGMPEAVIYIEDHSFNTIENAIYTLKLIQKNQLDISDYSLVLITSDYHMNRARIIFSTIFGSTFPIIPVESKTPLSIWNERRQVEDYLFGLLDNQVNSYLRDLNKLLYGDE